MKTELTLEVNLDQIVRSLSREDAAELIQKIDLRFAECDFTLSILNKLVRSLKSDLTVKEIQDSLTELKTEDF
jgi:hypothetical protein